jgi:hypothetical protein
MAMRREAGGAHHVDEARLGPLLERAYAARGARLAPADDALARLNATLDEIGAPPRPQRHADHRRLFGACALVAILIVLLGPVAHSEIAAGSRNAPRSIVAPTSGTVSRIVPPPVAVVASERADAPGRVPTSAGAPPTTGVSETPLRDLLARAGIHADDAPDESSRPGEPPSH